MTARTVSLLSALCALVIGLAAPSSSRADYYVWTGSVSTDWSNSANWFTVTIAGPNSYVISHQTHQPTFTTSNSALNPIAIPIIIGDNVTLTIGSGVTMYLAENGTARFEVSDSATATITTSTGSVVGGLVIVRDNAALHMAAAWSMGEEISIQDGGVFYEEAILAAYGGFITGAGTFANNGTVVVASDILDVETTALADASGSIWAVSTGTSNGSLRFNANYTSLSGDFEVDSSVSFIDLNNNNVATSGNYFIYPFGVRCTQILHTGNFNWGAGSCP